MQEITVNLIAHYFSQYFAMALSCAGDFSLECPNTLSRLLKKNGNMIKYINISIFFIAQKQTSLIKF